MRDLSWTWLGSCDPELLSGARQASHHALQLLTHAARAYVPEQPDDSHTSLAWNSQWSAWEGTAIRAGERSFSLALRAQDLTLLFLNAAGELEAHLPLHGLTLAQARAWLEERFAGRGLDVAAYRRPLHFEIPAHAVSRGAAFDLAQPLPYAELSRYYANAALVLQAMVSREDGATPVRCWPHHFDIATLLPVPDSQATIGFGLSPGDASYDQPYFYISPWPYPDPAKLPALPPPACWHTTGWTGMVLHGAAITALSSADAQQRLVEETASRVISLLKELLV